MLIPLLVWVLPPRAHNVFKNPLMGAAFYLSFFFYYSALLHTSFGCNELSKQKLKAEWQANLGGDVHWFLHVQCRRHGVTFNKNEMIVTLWRYKAVFGKKLKGWSSIKWWIAFASAVATVLMHFFLQQWETMTSGVENKPSAEQTAEVAVCHFPLHFP